MAQTTPARTARPTAELNRAKLITWLRERSTHSNVLIGATYEGLVTRIEAGEFDKHPTS